MRKKKEGKNEEERKGDEILDEDIDDDEGELKNEDK